MGRWPLTRWIESALVAGGALAFGFALLQLARAAAFQERPNLFVAAPVPHQASNAIPLGRSQLGPLSSMLYVNFTRNFTTFLSPLAKGVQLAGRIDVPRLAMTFYVVEGDDEQSLALAPGHIPGTAPLGADGNAVIAGHREMSFRALRNIKFGDEIKVQTNHSFTYRVKSIRIVKPDDLSVMHQGKRSTLTLVTCYPFYYLGSAPKRFVVQASRVRE